MKQLIVLSLIFMALGLRAQQMEMHSSSPEAIRLMNEALAVMGHDMARFEANIAAALEADPDMVAANFFTGINPNRPMEEGRPYVENVLAYTGEMSEGERLMQEMCTHFDEEDYDFMGGMSRLTELYPQDARMCLLVGMAYLYSETPMDGFPYLETAAQRGKLPGAYNLMGYAYLRSGNLPRAKAMFEQYIAAAPKAANPYDSMGDYYLAVEDYEAAATHFEKAAAMNPEQPIHAKKAKQARAMIKE